MSHPPSVDTETPWTWRIADNSGFAPGPHDRPPLMVERVRPTVTPEQAVKRIEHIIKGWEEDLSENAWDDEEDTLLDIAALELAIQLLGKEPLE